LGYKVPKFYLIEYFPFPLLTATSLGRSHNEENPAKNSISEVGGAYYVT
jgi:hypothetical protein